MPLFFKGKGSTVKVINMMEWNKYDLARELAKSIELFPVAVVVLSIVWALNMLIKSFEWVVKAIIFLGLGFFVAYSIGRAADPTSSNSWEEQLGDFYLREQAVPDLSAAVTAVPGKAVEDKPLIYIVGWTGMLLATIPGMYVTWPFC